MGHEYGGGLKDSWVLQDGGSETGAAERHPVEISYHEPRTTSRVAEAFYWMGRYLERAGNITSMLQVIQSLEAEELNSEERKLYRPTWSRLLPRVETAAGTAARRSIRTRRDRYPLQAFCQLNKGPTDELAVLDKAEALATLIA